MDVWFTGAQLREPGPCSWEPRVKSTLSCQHAGFQRGKGVAELLCTTLWKLRSVVTRPLEFIMHQVKRLREMRCLLGAFLPSFSEAPWWWWREPLARGTWAQHTGIGWLETPKIALPPSTQKTCRQSCSEDRDPIEDQVYIR